jgi:hypothetical protein
VTEPEGLAAIAALHETADAATATKYLNVGWVLLSLHVKDYGDPGDRVESTVYCLGWKGSLGEPVVPPAAIAHL